ncbi:class I adenylate-forming enzyme family protein [Sporosarcina siberiensis]|uniref:Class I adenylate-forming enzyme family protein n=1 Tax=Sporosarcina siberiensis TaxID=1365606 RepID=A0ABW4SIE9_9BACL
MMMLSNIMNENIKEFDEYDFLYFGNRTYTNIEVDRLSTIFSNYLLSEVENSGDKVIVYLANCPEVIISYQAILKAGKVVVPVMYALNAKEIQYIIEDSNVNTIITSNALLENIVKVAEKTGKKLNVIVTDNIENDAAEGSVNIHELEKIYNHSKSQNREELNISEDDLAVILYTSGTTGQPKGVMLTHRNLYISAQSAARLMKAEMWKKPTLVALPLAHSFGFTAMNTYLFLGSSVVIIERFNADEIFKAVEKHKIRTFTAVPAMIYGMVMNPNIDSYDLSSLEGVLSSSAPLPLALMEAFTKKTGTEVWQGYGLSEASPVVSTQWRGATIKPGSVGLPIDIVRVKIINDEGEELPRNEVGELAVKGLNVTPGYYQLEEETAKTIVDGWLRTGDLARIDEDGDIFIVDRKKDIIIRGGLNIFPRDSEEIIMTHPDVLEVAVIGVPDEEMGERVVAYVVKRPESVITELNVISHSQEHLAKYKTPQEVVFVDQLPRNGVGKILKRKISELYQNKVMN